MSKQATKYSTLLGKTQDTKEKEQLSFKVERAELTLQSNILATRELLSDAKAQLLSARSTYPFNAKAILEAEDEVLNIEKSIERLEGLKSMF